MSLDLSHPQRTRALLMLVVANFFWGLSFPLIKSILLLQEKLLPQAGSRFSTTYALAPRFLLAALGVLALKPLGWGGLAQA